MSVQLVEKTITSPEQKFNLPGNYSWEEFKLIQKVLHTSSRLKITYLDGFIEFMTLGERHEKIKTILGFLIEFYLVQKQIEFIPVISKITDLNTYALPSIWDIETDRGVTKLKLKTEQDIRRVSSEALLITDANGIQYLIKNRKTLDKFSKKVLDRFM